jgi:hypothetical protein
MNAENQLAVGTRWPNVIRFFLVVALIGVVLALAVIGLDALNDLMARGLTSMSNPGM